METILIAEDDFNVRSNLDILLTEEGFSTILAEDGLAAFELAIRKIPDVIISDIMMPKLSGFELLKKIKDNEKTKLIPVIFLSAKTERESIRKGMNCGADDFITKPFTTDEVLDSINSRLKKTASYNSFVENMAETIIKYVPHELRTPLEPILGYSDLLLNNIESFSVEELKEIVGLVKRSGLRLSGWINKFLLFTDLELQIEKLQITNIKSLACCSIQNIDWKSNFESNKEWLDRQDDINVELEPSELQINKEHLEFLIRELVENAAKFSDNNSQIFVKGKVLDSKYMLTISDVGDGFEDNDAEKISALKQFDRIKRQPNGNGIGLSIVSRLLFLNSGEMKIDSKKNEYTKVCVTIPLVLNKTKR